MDGPSIRPFVRSSVRPFVRSSVRPCVRASVRSLFGLQTIFNWLTLTSAIRHTTQVTLLVSMSGASTGFYMWGGANPTATAADAPPSSSRTTANSADAAASATESAAAATARERPCPTHGPTTGPIEADGSQVRLLPALLPTLVLSQPASQRARLRLGPNPIQSQPSRTT
jgi:hypothetical protein